MKAPRSFETLGTTDGATKCYIPEDLNRQSLHFSSLTYYRPSIQILNHGFAEYWHHELQSSLNRLLRISDLSAQQIKVFGKKSTLDTDWILCMYRTPRLFCKDTLLWKIPAFGVGLLITNCQNDLLHEERIIAELQLSFLHIKKKQDMRKGMDLTAPDKTQLQILWSRKEYFDP